MIFAGALFEQDGVLMSEYNHENWCHEGKVLNRMDLNRDNLLFDKYKWSADKIITEYECISNVPLRVNKSTVSMKTCKCGGDLVPLVYVFDDGVLRSKTLQGRKCPYCGNNYFTEKVIRSFKEAFLLVDLSDNESRN